MKTYRQLTKKEINSLTLQGCIAENWNQIKVTPDFNSQFVVNVHFSGEIFLEGFQKIFELRWSQKTCWHL